MPLERVPVDQPAPSRQQVAALITDQKTGAPARSQLDDRNLSTVAFQLGGTYVRADGTHDMGAVAAELEAVALGRSHRPSRSESCAGVWALALLLLLLPELRQGWRMYWQARRAGRA